MLYYPQVNRLGGEDLRTWLRVFRQNRGLSEKEVAQRVGISQTAYHYIETGERTPTTRTAQRIAAVLGFDWTAFFPLDKAQ